MSAEKEEDVGSLRLRRIATALACLAFVFMVPTSAAAATGEDTVAFGPVPMENPCNGDTVMVTGTMHMVWIASDTKLETQTNWPDTTGISLVSGTLYQANDASHFAVLEAPKDTATFTVQDSYELVSQDATSNFVVHASLVIKVDFDPFNVTTKVRGDPDGVCSG
jgi:hypothetical protein